MFYWVENWPGGKSSQQYGRTFRTAAEAYREASGRLVWNIYTKKFVLKAEKSGFCVIIKKEGCEEIQLYIYVNRFTVGRIL